VIHLIGLQSSTSSTAASASNSAMAELWQSGAAPGLTEFQRGRYLEVLRAKSAQARLRETAG
jgi:hypothetical protein